MKKNKKLLNLIRKLAGLSFENGEIRKSQVLESIKVLKSLPSYLSIFSLSAYLKEVKRLENKHTMYIETVVPLDTKELKMVKAFGKKEKITKIVTDINRSIIGGIKFKVDDQVWDGSLLGKINQVKETVRS